MQEARSQEAPAAAAWISPADRVLRQFQLAYLERQRRWSRTEKQAGLGLYNSSWIKSPLAQAPARLAFDSKSATAAKAATKLRDGGQENSRRLMTPNGIQFGRGFGLNSITIIIVIVVVMIARDCCPPQTNKAATH